MNRREFLKLAGITGIGFSIPHSLNPLLNEAESSERSRLVVVKGKSPSGITRTAIDAFGGMKKFISRGNVVVIKPNMAWDRVPEQAGYL